MPLPVSRSAADKLGQRLASSDFISDEDYAMLETILSSYQVTLDRVQVILEDIGLAPTSRVKSTATLVDKLRRGSSLSVQDLAGARIVVDGDRGRQDEVVTRIAAAFSRTGERDPRVVDRRQEPMHGYRAVHVVVHHDGLPVEIQVRTELQDIWAQLVESVGDRWGRGLRYGGTVDDPDRALRDGHSETRGDFVARCFEGADMIDRLELTELVARWYEHPDRARIMDQADVKELPETEGRRAERHFSLTQVAERRRQVIQMMRSLGEPLTTRRIDEALLDHL